VEVELAVADRLPGRTAEAGLPVVRRPVPVRTGAVPEEVALPFGRARAGREGGAEPGVLLGGVVGHQVDEDPQVALVQSGHHRVEVGQGAEPGVDVAVVTDVVTAVGQRRRVDRAQPDGVHTESGQVVGPGGDARQIPDAVAVAVGEAARVDLVDDRRAPPARASRHRCRACRSPHRVAHAVTVPIRPRCLEASGGRGWGCPPYGSGG
jgi:hypothetical protein